MYRFDLSEHTEKLTRGLFGAVEEFNPELIDNFIQKGADLSAQDKLSGKCILHVVLEKPIEKASDERDVLECINFLVKHKKDIVNSNNFNKETPLHLIAKLGYISFIDCLLNWDADIHARNNKGELPFHYVLFHLPTDKRQQEVIAYFLKKGEKFEDEIFEAAFRGDITYLKKCNPNQVLSKRDSANYTAMDYAKAGKHEKTLAYISNLKTVRTEETTSLSSNLINFVRKGFKAVTSFIKEDEINDEVLSAKFNELLDQDQRPKKNHLMQKSRRNETEELIFAAARHGNKDLFLELLLNNNYNINAKNSLTRESLLHCAVQSRSFEFVQMCLEMGADVNAIDGQGYPPLVYALKQGATQISEILLSFGEVSKLVGANRNSTTDDMTWKTKKPQISKRLSFLFETPPTPPDELEDLQITENKPKEKTQEDKQELEIKVIPFDI